MSIDHSNVGLAPSLEIQFMLSQGYEPFINQHSVVNVQPLVTAQPKSTSTSSLDDSIIPPPCLCRRNFHLSKSMVRFSEPKPLEQSLCNCHLNPGMNNRQPLDTSKLTFVSLSYLLPNHFLPIDCSLNDRCPLTSKLSNQHFLLTKCQKRPL